MDALIKMLKDNGNIHGYSFGASMIARTIELGLIEMLEPIITLLEMLR